MELEIANSRRSYVPPRSNWDMDTGPTPVHAYEPSRSPQHGRSNSGGNYFEDVEPRFANRQDESSAPLPSTLIPGSAGEPPNVPDDLPNGTCSPPISETSQFPSISERPVNSRWRPPGRPPRQTTDVLLGKNPDFEIPATRSRGASTGGRVPTMPLP